MKPTERYAAVALLLLVALVIVVGFWDTGESAQVPAKDQILAGGAATRLEESARPASRATVQDGQTGRQGVAQRPFSQSVPLSGLSSGAPRVDKVSTRKLSTAGHRVTPGGAPEQDRAESSRVRVEKHSKVAQSPDQLAGAMRPAKKRGAAGFDLSFDGLREEGAERNAPSRPFLPRTQPKTTGGAATPDREQKMAAATSVDVAKTRKEAATERKEAVSDPTLQNYKVKSGDALIRIAKRECGSDRAVAEIVRLNGLVDSDIIFPGMILKLPSRVSVSSKIASASGGGDTKVASSAGTSPSGTKDGRRRIRIQSGEVLGHVLEREFGTYRRSIALVQELNPGLDPHNVQVGQQILLPSRSEVPKAKAVKAPSRPVPATAKRAAAAPRVAVNTAPKSRAGRSSNGEFFVR